MKIREITKDSLKYPFSDWKKFLILGIIFVIIPILKYFGENVDLLVLFIGIAFVVGLLVNGYFFRIIKSTLDGKFELPEFNNWINMGVDGVKVYIVYIVYLIPVILLLIDFFLSSNGQITTYGIKMSAFDFIPAFNSVIWQGIEGFLSLMFFIGISFPQGHIEAVFGTILYPLGILYPLVVAPILLVAIVNMELDEGDLKSAFRIREIIEEISIIGWGSLIRWYILTGIIYMILMTISIILIYLFDLINHFLGVLVVALILYPYFSIFLARSVALFYMPEEDD